MDRYDDRIAGVLSCYDRLVISATLGAPDTVCCGPADVPQVQVAYIGNAGGGSGTLYYHGSSYPFTVGGLGVGGIGASTVDAEGEVYKMSNLSQFAGSYAQASYGSVVDTTSSGDLWMQNEAGVIMHLKAKGTGFNA